MMCIRLFSYGRPVVVRCKGFRLGMGWVGSVIWWIGLGWVDENRHTDNSGTTRCGMVTYVGRADVSRLNAVCMEGRCVRNHVDYSA